jgi:hypothetical protein
MRTLLALFIGLHATAHLVGFAGSWQLASPQDMPYKTTVLGGRLDLGDSGIRAVGVVWLLLAAAFLVAAIGILGNAAWWIPATMTISVASLAVCIVQWPEARIGALINVALIGIFALASRWPWADALRG